MDRPRVRSKATGKEMALPSWEEISAGGFLDQWAMNLMVMNAATRKFGHAFRLPEAGLPAEAGSGLSKFSVSRRFKALSQAKLEEWMSSDLSELDLVAIQIDGLHLDDHMLMIGAVGIVNFVPVPGHWGTFPLSVKGAANGTTSTEVHR